ncbi:MAG: hypothetical protein Q4F57_02910, partial [Weeksellaceae bacterium]|nr:hypothetical protein [Weeksellaceae bacterium]
MPDKIQKLGGGLAYQKHQVVKTQQDDGTWRTDHNFAALQNLPIADLYNAQTQAQANNGHITLQFAGLGGFLGLARNQNKSKTRLYYTDANADGLMDLIIEGSEKTYPVVFNRLVDGVPSFSSSSLETENLLIRGAEAQDLSPALLESLEFEIPATELVKVWQAPKTGYISFNNQWQADSNHKVSIEIQNLASEEVNYGIPSHIEDGTCRLYLGNPSIAANQFNFNINTPLGCLKNGSRSLNEIYVQKGQKLFFRLHESEAREPLLWNPSVYYTDTPPVVDQSGVDPYNSQYAESFVLSSESGVPLVFEGTPISAKVEWPAMQSGIVAQAPITFNVNRVKINPITEQETTTLIFQQTFQSGNTIQLPAQTIHLNNLQNPSNSSVEFIMFDIESQVNLAWEALHWTPVVKLESAFQNLQEQNDQVTAVRHGIPDKNIHHSYKPLHHPQAYHSQENNNATQLTSTASIDFQWQIPLNDLDFFMASTLANSEHPAYIDIVIRQNGKAMGPGERLNITNTDGLVQITPLNYTLSNLQPGTPYSIEFYGNEHMLVRGLMDKLEQNPQMQIGTASSQPLSRANVQMFISSKRDKLGHGYRNWGQFGYQPGYDQNPMAQDSHGKLLNMALVHPTFNEDLYDDLASTLQDLENLNE